MVEPALPNALPFTDQDDNFIVESPMKRREDGTQDQSMESEFGAG
jgi:hypothetical protein